LTKKAVKEFFSMQPGDVQNIFSDVTDLVKDFGYKPSTTLKDGLATFAGWYREWLHSRAD